MNARAGRPDRANLALSRKEDFQAFADAPRRIQPGTLTRSELRALDTAGRSAYDRARREWHANLGPIRTPQLASRCMSLSFVVRSRTRLELDRRFRSSADT